MEATTSTPEKTHQKEAVDKSTAGPLITFEEPKYRLHIFWSHRRVKAIEMNFSTTFCKKGNPRFTYYYLIPLPVKSLILSWSSCRGNCHQPSIRFADKEAHVDTRIHSIPSGGQFQEAKTDRLLEGQRLEIHLLLCHGLEENVDCGTEASAIMLDACFSVLALSATSNPQGILFADTPYHAKLTFETQCLLGQMASEKVPLRLLNGVGVFTYANPGSRLVDALRQSAQAKTTLEWTDPITDGLLGGLRANLYRAAFSATLTGPGGLTVRLYFVDDDWYPFNLSDPLHIRELENWKRNPGNRSKLNEWADLITPNIYGRTGIEVHSQFFTEFKYAGVILAIDHTILQILVPEALSPEVDLVEKQHPGPVVGRISGKDMQCQWSEDRLTDWTTSSFPTLLSRQATREITKTIQARSLRLMREAKSGETMRS